MDHGFITVAAAIPSVRVADCQYNIEQIERMSVEAENQGAEIIVFPELSVTGYSCQDLFRSRALLDGALKALDHLTTFSKNHSVIIIAGIPAECARGLLNSAVVVSNGEVAGMVPKSHLPNYNEFYEKRWFTTVDAGQSGSLFKTPSGVIFGIELCEDVWSPNPPSTRMALSGADIIFNLSATDELISKNTYLRQLLAQQSARLICGYVYSSCGFGESTQDVVYGGNAMIFENGRLIESARRFCYDPQLVVNQIDIEYLRTERRSNTTFTESSVMGENPAVITTARTTVDGSFRRLVNPLPFVPEDNDELGEHCGEIIDIQTAGLAGRLRHIGCHRLAVGVSGGLDSTLALLIAVKAFDRLGLDRHGVIAVTMPGFGTTDRTHSNAWKLMRALGTACREINISKAVLQHFSDIAHDPGTHDVTYENSQARERTQLLMDIANQENGIVLGTGDLSELALGWCTYNGDHMSMYGVNAGVPKTLVRYIIAHIAERTGDTNVKTILRDILNTPISPELLPADSEGQIAQKTEDIVGPYELHDFFLYHTVRRGESPSRILWLAEKAFDGHDKRTARYDKTTIRKWLDIFCRRFFAQQFKRSCMPDGPKVGSVSLSPRGDWRMPSDAWQTLWRIEE